MTGPIEPYLKLGTICERVLQEKDNVLSLIRIVDQFTVTITGKEPPDQLPRGFKPLTIIMSWVGGLGSHEAAFNIISPGGETQRSPQSWSFTLNAINQGHNIIVTLPVSIVKEGVYWIEFILNDQVKSRIPFQILYERQKLRA
jgi:hypothetical protein